MDKPVGLIGCLDVAYGDTASAAACVLLDAWDAHTPVHVQSMHFPGRPADYEPGAFFRRELPLLTALVDALELPIGVAVVDGYVWLSADGKSGLGAHLFEHLCRAVPVIGVAKTRFRGDTWSIEVYRASSRRPLLVTSAGLAGDEAAACICRMHGDHRIPTMLLAADRAARDRLT